MREVGLPSRAVVKLFTALYPPLASLKTAVDAEHCEMHIA